MMDDENGFYIVLPSNVQPDLHPENRANCYRTTFDESYELSGGGWEVALHQITFVNAMQNIIDESYELYEEILPNTSYIIKTGNKPGQFKNKHKDAPVKLTYNATSNRYGLEKTKSDDQASYFMLSGAVKELGLRGVPRMVSLPPNLFMGVIRENETKVEGVSEPTSEILYNNLNIYPKEATDVSRKRTNVQCFTREIPAGYYKTGTELRDALNPTTQNIETYLNQYVKDKHKEMTSKEKCEKVVWDYSPQTDHFSVLVHEGVNIQFKNGLHEILGFKEEKLTGKPYHRADYPPLLNRGVYSLYIYCSLVSAGQVGNTKAPLLQAIGVEERKGWGTTQTLNFSRLMYVPVNTVSFNSILIDIRDDTGKPVHFVKGKTIITLHLRRRRLKL